MMPNLDCRTRRRAWAALLLAALLPACSDGGGGGGTVTERARPVETVEVTGVPDQLYVGASTQLTAVHKDAAGATLTGRATTWTVQDSTVAGVTAQGMVTGRRQGPTFLTAVSEGKSATVLLNVTLEPVASINVTGKPAGPVTAGTTFQLQATPLNAAGTPMANRPVFWMSGNQALATVTAQGQVTALRGGEVIISANVGGTQSGFMLQIRDTIATLAVTPAAPALYETQTVTLTATATSAHGTPVTGRTVAWSTSNPARAAVDAEGKVTAISAGEVSITATVEGKTASATVQVRARPVASWAGATEWGSFQANAGHTGHVEVTADPVVFRELWTRRPLGGDALTPATEGGGRVFVSSNNGRMAALDARTGTTSWTYDFNNGSMLDAPAYGNGRVYVGTGGHSDTFLYGLDAASGAVVFRTPFGNQWSHWFAPVVSGGRVFKAGGGYGGMYAFDAASGDRRWFQELSQDDGWTPAVDGSRVYAYVSRFEEGELRAYDATTGALLYTIPDPDWARGQISLHPTPVVGSRNNVIMTQGDRLVSFDLGTQTIAWQRSSRFFRTPVVADGLIYVMSNNDVEVRRETDGSLAWIWDSPTNQYVESMFATDNLLFVSTIDGTYVVDLAARQTVWTYPAGGALTLTRDGVLVITQADGDVAAIDLK